MKKVKVPVLAFHDVSKKKTFLSVTPFYFFLLVKYFKLRGFKSIQISEFINHLEKKEYDQLNKKVIFTFDDAFSSVLKNAFPILERNNYKGNLFVTTKYIGKEINEFGRRKYPKMMLLSRKQILKLVSSGWEVHAHSHAHSLFNLDEKGLQKDFSRNKKNIQDNFLNYNSKHMAFCYPTNKTNTGITKQVKKHFAAAFGRKDVSFSLDQSRFYISRIEFGGKTNTFFLFFKNLLS